MFRYRPRSFRRSAFLLLLSLVSTASILAANSQPPPDPPLDPPLDPLRSLDRQLERWAWQLATPDAVKPDAADLEVARDRLRRLAAAEDESARKADVLLRRAEELHRSATSRLALTEHALEPVEAPRSLVPTHKAAGCSAAMVLPVGEWIVDPASTADGLWLAFTAPEAGTWLVHTAGSRADTKLERWSDCAASAPVEVNDDGIGLRSRLVIEAEAGETVRLRLTSTADDRVLVAATRASTGSLSGRVTAAATGEPLSGVRLEVYRATSPGSTSYAGSALADGEGRWRVDGLVSGIYFVWTDLPYSSPYIDQVYDGVDCSQLVPCSLSIGTPITVDGSVSGIDLTLHEGASITGRLLETRTGLPIENVRVEARSLVDVRSDYTDAAGRYEIRGLQGNQARVRTTSPLHLDELWPDDPCESSGCDPSLGVWIPIAVDETVEGVDFRLARLASLSGRVTSTVTGLPTPHVPMAVFDSRTGINYGITSTDSNGRYTLGGLRAGDYRVRASGFEHPPTYWPDEICFSDCVSAGMPVNLSAGEWVEDIDFAVSGYGSIVGEVVDAETAEGVDSGELRVYDEAGTYLANAYVYRGVYRVDRVLPGSRHLVFHSARHQDEVWNDVPCSLDQVCDPQAGDLIDVAPDEVVREVDFVVIPYQDLEGRVTWEDTGAPVAGVGIEILEQGATRNHPLFASTDSEGRYAFRHVAPGTYSVRTRSDEALDEVYDDIPCEGSGCDPTTGTGVVVGLGSPTTGIDFALARFASFRGTVRDSESGEPIAFGGSIHLYRDDGSFQASTDVRDDGTYELVGVPAGTYHLAARELTDHLDQDVGAGNCSVPAGDCAPLSGTAFAIELGTEVVQDIDLVLGAVLEGSVVDSKGASLFGQIYVFDSNSRELGYAWTDTSGGWRFPKLPAGAHHVLFDSPGIVTTWWPDQPVDDACPQAPCDPSGAPSVSVTLGETRSIALVVDRLGSLQVTLIDSETGGFVSSARIALYDAAGSRADSSRVDAYGTAWFSSLEPGPRYLVVEDAGRHLEQVHGGEFCDPDCDPTTGTPVSVPVATTTTVPIQVVPGPGVSGRVLDAGIGAPIPGVGLDLWNEFGEVVGSAASGIDGSFRLFPFVSGGGTYYVSTDTGSEYGDIVWDGVDCPDGPAFGGGCDPTSGTPIVLENYQPLVPIEIRLEGGTPPTIFRDGFESGTLGAWSTAP